MNIIQLQPQKEKPANLPWTCKQAFFIFQQKDNIV